MSYTDVNQNNTNAVDLDIVEENNYYPFGLKHKGYNGFVSIEGNDAAQRWKFGGKEYMQDMDLNWYDVSARNYDPALGRWMNIDPLADQMRRHSPYNYAFDNPIFFIDADGMAPAASNGYSDYSADEADAYGIETTAGTVSGTDAKTGKRKVVYASDSKYRVVAGGKRGSGGGNKSGAGCKTGDCFSAYFKSQADELQQQLDRMSQSGSDIRQRYPKYSLTKDHLVDFNVLSRYLSLTGTIWGKVDLNLASKIYPTKWGMKSIWLKNGKVRSANALPYAAQFKLFKTVSNGFAIAGTAVDVLGVYNYYKYPNDTDVYRVSLGRAGFNGFFTGLGLWGGPVGWVGSGMYFGTMYLYDEGYMDPAIEGAKNRVKKSKNQYKGSCFVKGTIVLMADYSKKNIEDIEVGDKILSVNINTMTIEPDLVVDIPDILKKYRIIEAKFGNGVTNKFSPAHPYWVENKGWCVFDLKEAESELTFKVNKLEVGDVVLYYDAEKLARTKILSLFDTNEYIEMYNVEFVKKNHTFFANGILVHNKLEE